MRLFYQTTKIYWVMTLLTIIINMESFLIQQKILHFQPLRDTDFSKPSNFKIITPENQTENFVKWMKRAIVGTCCIIPFYIEGNIHISEAKQYSTVNSEAIKVIKDTFSSTSPGIRLARQKRTTAVKAMRDQGILSIDTDDLGNQFLSLPWIPNQKILYKSLPINDKLLNELFAGALGEISKDILLHAVDTAKTRRQAQIKNDDDDDNNNILLYIRELYSGFPIVAVSSIPQGGIFFLMKKGSIEILGRLLPNLPYFLSSTVPIGFGVMAYWLFRTPAEVIKTQVQTKQVPTVTQAIEQARSSYSNGLLGLWKHYPVMLCLDIPFQIVNFILFASLTEFIKNIGIEQSILTRLFCGTTCGMISAGLTCPLDVCKTRIISRDKEAIKKRNELLQLNILNSTSLDADINQPNGNMFVELMKIYNEEGIQTLFLGLKQRLLYTGFANGIRLAAYGTARMDLMMKSLDSL